MSSYLQRLLDTGAPAVSVAPVPQSTSPIADADQRLLIADAEAPPLAFGDAAPDGAGEIPAPEQKVESDAGRVPAQQEAREIPAAPAPAETALQAEIAAPPQPSEAPALEPWREASGEEQPDALREQTTAAHTLLPQPDTEPPAPAPPGAPVMAEPEIRTRERIVGLLYREDAPVPLSEGAPLEPVQSTEPDAVAMTGPEATRVSSPPEAEPVQAVEPAPVELPPLPAPPEPVIEHRVERIVERQIVRTAETPAESPPETPKPAAARTAASLSRIGPLPQRMRLRRINGLRWR